ncbi:hypothetical protein EOD39_5743 [Acipenser ruthenus]|uniref:Uncharacterized protein n=1 Tax=Acipenser ruthenus TaxID=7906 RepID=A0A444UD40_ACIRT|nr:hypothetical protein EOD39_5743 [Acipenser ruthenus]
MRGAIAALQTTVDSLVKRVVDVETSLTVVDNRVTSLESTCAELSALNKKLCAKVDDLEDRSRWQNLRVMRIPEGKEGSRPDTFMSDFLG